MLQVLLVEPSLTQRLWLRALLDAAGCGVTAVPGLVAAALHGEKHPERFDIALIAARLLACDEAEQEGGSKLPVVDARPWVALERDREPGLVRAVRRRGALDQLARPRTVEEARTFVDRLIGGAILDRNAPAQKPGFRGSRIPRNDRTRLVERIEDELVCALALGTPLSLVLMSLENLPEVKIEDGREVADAILLEIEARLLESARPGEFVARNTGCEIALLMPDTDAPTARGRATRLIREARETSPAMQRSSVPLKLHHGVATSENERPMRSARSLIAKAIADARRRAESRSAHVPTAPPAS